MCWLRFAGPRRSESRAVASSTSGFEVELPSNELTDSRQSPAIDWGDPASPVANDPAPNGGNINLLAFGNTPQASKSPSRFVLVSPYQHQRFSGMDDIA